MNIQQCYCGHDRGIDNSSVLGDKKRKKEEKEHNKKKRTFFSPSHSVDPEIDIESTAQTPYTRGCIRLFGLRVGRRDLRLTGLFALGGDGSGSRGKHLS